MVPLLVATLTEATLSKCGHNLLAKVVGLLEGNYCVTKCATQKFRYCIYLLVKGQ